MQPELPAIVPEPIREKVKEYVAKASHLKIDPNRILICACLLSIAERDSNCYLPPGSTLPTVPYESIGGAWFGLSWDESTPEIIRPRYKRARKAMQNIHASAAGALTQIKKLDSIFKPNREFLPMHVQKYQTQLSMMKTTLAELVAFSDPGDDLMKSKRKKLPTEIFNVSQLTFVWWRVCLIGNSKRGSSAWLDMFYLARVWGLTRSRTSEDFRRGVFRLSKHVAGIWPPPKWCFDLCHWAA